jgi:hypothetical protein
MHTRCSVSGTMAAMTQSDETSLYDRFVLARRAAIEATDRHSQLADGDPRQTKLWEQVMHRTELARQLLVAWLETAETQDEQVMTEAPSRRELVLV